MTQDELIKVTNDITVRFANGEIDQATALAELVKAGVDKADAKEHLHLTKGGKGLIG